MAAGDVVNVCQSGNITFQPAVGVECVITSYGNFNNPSLTLEMYNGTTSVIVYLNNTYGAQPQAKMFINNTNYARVNGGGVQSISGIQTK